MAKIGSLVADLRLESASFIRDIRKASQETARATQAMQSSVAQLQAGFTRAGRTLAGFFTLRAAGEAARDVMQYADAWKLANNQVAAASSIAGRSARSLSEINDIANATRSGISETAELYAKLLRSTADVADSEEEVARATEIVTKAFKAGGASINEQVNGIRQLSQALGSGVLQGDELRSIRENAPLIAQAIAKEFQTTIGGLKKLGAEGKLTSDRVFKAILENSGPIEQAFSKTNATIAESFTIISNSLTKYIGTTDKALGISARFAEGAVLLAKNFDTLANSIFSSQGSITAFIAAYKEFQALLAGATANANKEQFGELGDVLVSIKNAFTDNNTALGNFGGKLGGIFHPFNAFINQLKDALAGVNALIRSFKSIPDKPLGGITDIVRTPPAPLLNLGLPKTFTPKPQLGLEGNTATDIAKQKEFADSLAMSTSAAVALVEAARKGKTEFNAFNDVLEATMDVIKAGINPTSEEGLALVQLGVNAREAARQLDQIQTTLDDTTVLQQQVGQYKLLELALSMGGDEFRKLNDHITLLNTAQSQNINLSTAEGQAWLKAAEAAQALGKEVDRAKEVYDDFANTINSTVSSAIGSVASSFADAVVEGKKFQDVINDLLKDLAKLALDATMQLFLRQIIGGVGTSSQAGTGLLGSLMHTGGIVGKDRGPSRNLPALAFAGAPRFHGGMMPGEYAAILKKGEGVFTPEQMKSLGGRGGDINVNVVNRSDTSVSANGKRNSQGDIDIEVVIDQVMSRKLLEPGSGSNRALKQGFGAQPVGIRR